MPYIPETQLRLQSAFILNLQNHWLPIRRFSSPNRWYNLNSFLDAPQWISPTFLAMVLTQAEEEGYNVFVVRPLDPTSLGDAENGTTSALPESQADIVALELGEPEGGSAGGVSNISTAHSSTYASVAATSSTASANRQTRSQSPTTPASPADPVAASLARSRAALDAFTREQEAVLRHGSGSRPGRRRRQEDVPTIFDDEEHEERASRASSGVQDNAPPPWNRFQQQRAEEEEMMRQAIEASLVEARERGEKVEDVLPTATAPTSATVPANLRHSDDVLDNDVDQDEPGPDYDLLADQRHYDDEDAALQAALSASLADAGVVGLRLPAEQPVKRTSSVKAPPAFTEEPTADDATKVGAEPEVQVSEEIQDDDEDEPMVEELSPGVCQVHGGAHNAIAE